MVKMRDGLRLPPVMAHRGGAAKAPENSLAAFRQAAAAGIGWVEIDVMLTRDRVPVLFHDDSLERITGRPALMAETDFADLADLDAGSWFAPAFAEERIASLETALALFLELGLHPNIEIKPTPGRDVETAVEALAVIRDHWPSDRSPPLISSFSRMSLAAARALEPDLPRALIAHRFPNDWQSALEALGCVAFHCNSARLTWEIISLVRNTGVQVAAFTVNDSGRAADLFDSGIDCVISDDPVKIQRAFEKSRRPGGARKKA